MFQFYPFARIDLQIVFYVLVLLTFIYLCYVYRKKRLSILLILLFYTGLFEFLGISANNIYKIVVLGLTLLFTLQRKSRTLSTKGALSFAGVFLCFSIAFCIAVYQGMNNTLTIVLSQYARYVEFFCLYFLLYDAVYTQQEGESLIKLFYQLFLIQILVSIIKLLLFQHSIESLVGTMALIGGAFGTIIPILGFIVLYFYRNGKLLKVDWLFVAGLLMVGFTAGKRAVWFILPIVIAAFLIYVRSIRLNKYLILGLCVTPIVFYFGARLTPSLNPENKVWGSFDWEYMFGYAERYQFGEEGLQGYSHEEQVQLSSVGGHLSTRDGIDAEGRGGATIALIELLFSPKYTLTDQDIYGLGFSSMYSTDYASFEQLPLTIRVSHKGDATGVFQSYVTTGYLGVFTTILLMFFPFFLFKNKRLKVVILIILAWEYFMYTGMLFRTPAFTAVMLFILHYTNKQYYDYQAAKRAEQLRQMEEREKARAAMLVEAAEAETA